MKIPLLLMYGTVLLSIPTIGHKKQEKVEHKADRSKTIVQEPPTLPVGTILFLKSTKDIYAKNFGAGDHFFVELDRDVTQKGKVLVPKGTIVQMEVLVSENKKRRSSTFAVTVGGALGLLQPGQSIHFPAGTEATFQLELPLQVNWL